MRNQRSWRLLTEIEPNDSNIQVSKVIGKVDANGDSFYPLFTKPTTVVIMSDDKRIFETCKATADGAGNMILTKRGLSDDATETEVATFKKDWLPGSYMFATMGAADATSVNDDNTWIGDQTFQGELNVQGEFNISGDFDMETDGNVAFVTTGGDMTFQDQNVGPVTLSQMIHPAGGGSSIEVMSDDDWSQVTTPALNTAYMRHATGDTMVKKMYFNGSDYDLGGGEIKNLPGTPVVLKYERTGTQAQYDALGSYRQDTRYNIY